MKDTIKNHKNFDKRANETNKKLKEEGLNWNKYYYYWKKIINLILRIKLKIIKTLIKEPKKTKTKTKVEGPNQQISYTQIRIEGLNWIQIKL